jgi:hypothetical protein
MVVLALVLTPLVPESTVVAALPHSLDLNGTSAFADVADAPELDLVADWTIELWFKDESSGGYSHPARVLLTKDNPLVDRNVPYGMVIAFNVLAVGERSGNAGRLLTYNLAAHGVSANMWHHVAATMEAASGRLTLYLDGVQVAQRIADTGTRNSNSRPLTIGRDGNSGFFWDGKLDDVRLWNVARTREQIRANYRQLSGTPAGLMAHWQLDESAGSVAHDRIGEHHATLRGGAVFSSDVPAPSPATPTPTPTRREHRHCRDQRAARATCHPGRDHPHDCRHR